ncbi:MULTISPECIES: Fe-S cluster assembly protein SufD [Subtercola]|uniref:Fe-S cluster assembly protein SufD n=1 Tax=Subtercola vilae TaxID=2056433 RepID=A0A4T2CAU9_9MICO|nr:MULTISPECIES: Fe-S cluster assembly protein SufD [Subtercola]MEA9983736.1 Fe-S cluster assembly protein SufD [Subtercola sp. RTI3]TIH40762.1 Fe-S cluster assembly protein SufD [Subtercola vilae]
MGSKSHTDGAWSERPVQTRSERYTSPNVVDFDEPTGHEVDWKLTPIKRITGLISGELDGSPFEPALEQPVDGFELLWIDRTDPRVGSAGLPEDKASANAWSGFEKALAIEVTGEEPTAPFVLTRDGLGETARAAHTVITARPNSRGLVILQNSGDAQLTENVEIVVKEGAHLTVVSVQQWNDSALHVASHFAQVGRDASLRHIVVSLGGAVVRVNPSIHLSEQGSSTEAYGLYFADAGQHLEQRVYIDHEAENSRSRVKYKGALQGEGAHSVWVGDVLIRQSANGTDSYEENRNLVLSEGTRADSIPNLEIETGNIIGAGHASSTGRFDDEQLFYLQSRGISEEEARRLVVRGFLAEIIQQIGAESVEARLSAAVEAELTLTVGAV